MQAADGALVEIMRKQGLSFLEHGNTNLVKVGDVFHVRGCYFCVEAISEDGVSAKGITRHEYLKAKAVMPLMERLAEIGNV